MLPSVWLTDSTSKDLYNQPISKLVEFIIAATKAKPGLAIEVFVHKAEKLQEEDKIGAGAVTMPMIAWFSHHLQRITGKSMTGS